ncbi:MAG: type II toxin-antitoxin system Phd/YefM family antitoxin [Gammaproteobacteria bacterium]|nr:type II toxin-antitoxin system Phd/YefM family antitoxin [Gammaproteobacteria bacterium]
MKASVVDLRYKMNDILKALDRNEEVTVLYHGKVKGVIVPSKERSSLKVENSPFFGMLSNEDKSVAEEMEELRGGRFRDL